MSASPPAAGPGRGSSGPRPRLLPALAVAAAIGGLTAGCSSDSRPPQPPSNDDLAAWRAGLDAWVERRLTSLHDPEGWLSLAGLYWLEPGETSFGADPANAVVFPAGKAPARAGVLELREGVLTMRPEPGVEITHDGQPVSELALATDVTGAPTILALGPLRFHAIDRGGRIGIRLRDTESPLLQSFAGIERFEPDPRWRLEARLEPYDPPRTVMVPNVLGGELPEPCPGILRFEVDGNSYALEPTGEPGAELFVVFGDATNGHQTYGGGRFLYADWPGPDGRVELDFNRAYNPPCVFTPWATCPLPPPQNRLAFAVKAGEQVYRGVGTH